MTNNKSFDEKLWDILIASSAGTDTTGFLYVEASFDKALQAIKQLIKSSLPKKKVGRHYDGEKLVFGQSGYIDWNFCREELLKNLGLEE